MKKLDHTKIIQRADEIYGQLKADKFPSIYSTRRVARATLPLPKIKSDQVKALCQAICEALNEQPKAALTRTKPDLR